MLRGRCACNAVAFEVADEFFRSYNCHCSNCRATTGSAYMPWGETARENLRVTKGEDSLKLLDFSDGVNHEAHCGECLSLLYWTSQGTYVRVPYGALVDEPTLKPMGHMFVGSKASWHEITDNLPQHAEYPWPAESR